MSVNSMLGSDIDMRIDESCDEVAMRHLRNAKLFVKQLEDAYAEKQPNRVDRCLGNLKSSLIDLEDDLKTELSEAKKTAVFLAIPELKQTISSVEEKINFAAFYHSGQSGSVPSGPREQIDVKIQWKAIPFYGNPREWPRFWDLFNAGVHSTELLPETKVKCLTDCLKGNSDECLGSIAKIASNYESIIETLQKRYNNPETLLTIYQEDLEELPPVVDPKQFRATLDKVKAIIKNITGLGADYDTSYLKRLVIRKFPDSVLLPAVVLANRSGDGEFKFSVEALLATLNEYIEAAEYIALNKPAPTETVKTTTFVGATKRHLPNEKEKQKTLQCAFDGLTHPTVECRKFNSVEARRRRLAELEKCFNCLGPNHTSKECKHPRAKCRKCQQMGHNTALCFSSCASGSNGGGAKHSKRAKTGMCSDTNVFLRTFTCTIYGSCPEGIVVRGMFDPGSEYSYIESRLAERLQLKRVVGVKLECFRFATDSTLAIESAEVTVPLFNEENIGRTFDFFTTPNILSEEASTSPSADRLQKCLPRHLKYADADLFKTNRRPVQLLIGANLYHQFVALNSDRALDTNLLLLNTFFGWIPSGTLGPPTLGKSLASATSLSVGTSPKTNSGNPNSALIESPSEMLVVTSKEMQNLFNLETLGIENPDTFKNDEAALEHTKNTMFVQSDGRYNTSFPWKEENSTLPTNFRMALARLKSLLSRSSHDILSQADKILKDQESLEIIEIAPPLPNKPTHSHNPRRVHYLPFRIIFQKGKLRIVYDASAKTKTGASLNELIHKGPDLTQDLIGLLLNFRLFSIGLTADIEKAYHQINLNELDRDVTRFLWLKDITKPPTPDNLKYYRFARVPFGVNAAPYLLNLVLQDILSTNPENTLLQTVRNKFYVDDLVLSVRTPNVALGLYETLTQKLSSAGMNLRDWITNHPSVQNAITKSGKLDADGKTSVLGILWDRASDTISCKMNSTLPTLGTKANVLRYIASVYDPLGLLAPCLLELKLFLRKCWKNKFQWNQSLPPMLQAEWMKLRNDSLLIPEIHIPRRYFGIDGEGEYSLHVFCDASHKAFACCAYLVITNKYTGNSASALIFAKSRVAPLTKTPVTTPRLELMAVVIGKRCANFLTSVLEIQVTEVTLWTDATTVLQWLHSTEVQQTFVANRLNEIKRSPNLIIRHVPGAVNPADFASRGKSPKALRDLDLWWRGPSWLPIKALWPTPPDNVISYQTPQVYTHVVTKAMPNITSKPNSLTKSLLTHENEFDVSTWNARIGAFRVLIRFCFEITKSTNKLTDTKLFTLAERLLVIELQRKYFSKEYKILKSGGKPNNNLDLFLSTDIHDADGNIIKKGDNLIRCRGRLLCAKFPWETIHPALLPRDSPATIDYIRMLHEQNGHIGVSHLLAKLRERFWIVKGRAIVKSVIHRCVTCRTWEGGSYPLPPIPPLPEVRVADTIPFLQVGIDYFGPLHILTSTKQIGDVHVLLFTCLVTRAIHLELVPNTSGKHCLLALDRFCSIRRVPKFIVSDNGASFEFIQPFLGIKVNIRDHKLNKFLSSNQIEWYFIPRYAPWFGGAYERLIGLVKRSLKKSYGSRLLDYEEVRTVLCHIMDIINSRPLNYISSDEVLQPLTPNHFLKLGPTNVNLDIFPVAKPPVSATGAALMRDWYHISRVLDAYWDAFRSLYLTSLRERHIMKHPHKKGSATFSPSVGDVVLVQEISQSRANWKLGLIKALDKRQALATLTSNGRTMLRSIRQLYPLEVQCDRPILPSPMDSATATNPIAGPSHRSV